MRRAALVSFVEMDENEEARFLGGLAAKAKGAFEKMRKKVLAVRRAIEKKHKRHEKWGKEQRKRDHIHHMNKKKLQAVWRAAQARYHKHLNNFHAARRVFEEAARRVRIAQAKPANQRYGKLPRYAAHQGYLRIQRGSHHEQNAFL